MGQACGQRGNSSVHSITELVSAKHTHGLQYLLQFMKPQKISQIDVTSPATDASHTPIAPTTTRHTLSTMAAPSALTFLPKTFAKLSPAAYLTAHLSQPSGLPSRPSSRAPNEPRPVTANLSSLTHCFGSAVVRSGDTAVVCGVRAEILYARDVPRPYRSVSGQRESEVESLGLLVPNVELSTGCAREFLPGNAPGSVAQSLSARVKRLLHVSGMVAPGELRIYGRERDAEAADAGVDESMDDADPEARQNGQEVKAYWTLYIDTLVMSLDGNAFDTVWAAVVAALKDTRLPAATWDADTERVVCAPDKAQASSLKLTMTPFAKTFAVFEARDGSQGYESWTLADPDAFEEGLCEEMVTAVVDGRGNVIKIEKSGGAVIGMQGLRDLVEDANRRWRDWERILT